jgi:riboflavin biosynthesis pyrimidine reductase
MMRFDEYCRRKEAAALAATLPAYRTVFSHVVDGLAAVGNGWSRHLFDGPFYRTATSAPGSLDINLVFVQSREGNTGADDPSTLGGGETDKHLIYEGLSRVDVDAVLSGASTAREPELVFSVWHPEMVALRRELGHGRHPAQIIVTQSGELPLDEGLMFTTPELRVIVVSTTATAVRLSRAVASRPWIDVIDAGNPLSLPLAMTKLRDRGIRAISCVGGRATATVMLRAGIVSDLYLTTSPISAGEPHTPFYEGPPLSLTKVVEKVGQEREAGVRFEHFVVGNPKSQAPNPKSQARTSKSL